MATRFIHKGLDPEQGPYSNVAPFCVDDEGKLVVNRGAEFKGNGLTTDPQAEPIPVTRIINATASFTVTPADSGAVIAADSTSSVVVQLPATQKGLTYTLTVKQLTGTGGHAFSPVAADKIIYASKADDADIVCSAASDAVGNCITIVGDGVDGWLVTSVFGTWA